MPIQETAPKYKTTDGKEFSTKEAAERHEKLSTAERDYKAARHSFSVALAETQTTADGRAFKFGVLSDYHIIAWSQNGQPYLQSVSFYAYNCDVDEDDRAYITQVTSDTRRRYRFADLYWNKRAAEAAVLVEFERWFADQTERLEALRLRVHGEP